jgi:aromatic-L-amino-acid decarboxylase
MKTLAGFNRVGHELVDWLTDYFKDVENLPVKPDINPGDIEKILPQKAPLNSETPTEILRDLNEKIMPGITHWQHPGFHAYFPANNSYPSVLADIVISGLGVQGMKWITSPSATELEKVVMRWLQQMIDLPDNFKGVIMDTASVSTLCAILAARERATEYKINENGFENTVLRYYCSSEAHSSIEKAVRIAGIGSKNLIKIPVDSQLRIIPSELEKQIEKDLKDGFTPACVIGAMGTTGSGSIDPLDEIAEIAKKHKIWYHIDAAYAGNALILPEFRESIQNYRKADSFVFNPHKWLLTNFDCSAFFVRDLKLLTKTFSLVPAYLQTGHDDEIDYSNWGIQLGRRFRSLKLWFVIRSYGVEGLQNVLRSHIKLGEMFESFVASNTDFEIVTPRNLNIICFRYKNCKEEEIDAFNQKLLDKINQSGKVFLSHTLIHKKYVIRFVCGQTNVEKRHIENAWKIINDCAKEIKI